MHLVSTGLELMLLATTPITDISGVLIINGASIKDIVADILKFHLQSHANVDLNTDLSEEAFGDLLLVCISFDNLTKRTKKLSKNRFTPELEE